MAIIDTNDTKKANVAAEAENGDLIAAIATPPGAGGVGIIRLSGRGSGELLGRVFHTKQPRPEDNPRYMTYGVIRDPEDGRILDRCLAVYMPAPRSYTGEDVAELQCHGGPRLLGDTLALCLRQGARMATAGEFTLRAFLNGRIDLTQAEAVADLISAKTSRAVGQAQRQLSGALSQKLLDMESGIREILALITVGVDFPDDEDAPDSDLLIPMIVRQRQRIEELLAGGSLGLACREGVRAVLTGAVNAGKSSLMNALLGRDRAIVTNEAGTTRDVLEEYVDIAGIPVCLVDTAGLRDESLVAEAERLGISRSRAMAQQAALLLSVVDASLPADKGALPVVAEDDRRKIVVLNKVDKANEETLAQWRDLLPKDAVICQVSAVTGQGLDDLRREIATACAGGLDPEADSPLLNNVRHIEALRQAAAALDAAINTLEQGFPPDMAGVELEEACAACGRVTGNAVSEDVLTEIFAKFCVGK